MHTLRAARLAGAGYRVNRHINRGTFPGFRYSTVDKGQRSLSSLGSIIYPKAGQKVDAIGFVPCTIRTRALSSNPFGLLSIASQKRRYSISPVSKKQSTNGNFNSVADNIHGRGMFDVFVYDCKGDYVIRRMNKADLLVESGLNARDLIILDSGFHRRPRPVILIRESSMVLSFAFIRAIIRADGVYLFHPGQDKVQSFAAKLGEFLKGLRAPFLPHVVLGGVGYDSEKGCDDFLPVYVEDTMNQKGQKTPWTSLEKMFGHIVNKSREEEANFDGEESPAEPTPRSKVGEESYTRNLSQVTKLKLSELPFELKALEGILSQVCRLYHNRTLLLSPLVKNVLTSLSAKQVDPEVLHQLLPMKDALSTFEIETSLMRNAVAELMENEDQMLEMLLTEKSQSGGQMPPREMHVLVELVLENYVSQLVDISQEAYYLRKRVEGTEGIIQLKLDTFRNHMVHINLQLTLATVALACGTVLSGLLGANLTNGYEDHPFAFYALCGGSLIIMTSVYKMSRAMVARSMPRSLSAQDGSLFSIFNHLEDIQQVLAHVRKTKLHGGRVSRERLRQLLLERSGLRVEDDDLDVVFSTFDRDEDGILTITELHREIVAAKEKTIEAKRSVYHSEL